MPQIMVLLSIVALVSGCASLAKDFADGLAEGWEQADDSAYGSTSTASYDTSAYRHAPTSADSGYADCPPPSTQNLPEFDRRLAIFEDTVAFKAKMSSDLWSHYRTCMSDSSSDKCTTFTSGRAAALLSVEINEYVTHAYSKMGRDGFAQWDMNCLDEERKRRKHAAYDLSEKADRELVALTSKLRPHGWIGYHLACSNWRLNEDSRYVSHGCSTHSARMKQALEGSRPSPGSRCPPFTNTCGSGCCPRGYKCNFHRSTCIPEGWQSCPDGTGCPMGSTCATGGCQRLY